MLILLQMSIIFIKILVLKSRNLTQIGVACIWELWIESETTYSTLRLSHANCIVFLVIQTLVIIIVDELVPLVVYHIITLVHQVISEFWHFRNTRIVRFSVIKLLLLLLVLIVFFILHHLIILVLTLTKLLRPKHLVSSSCSFLLLFLPWIDILIQVIAAHLQSHFQLMHIKGFRRDFSIIVFVI